MTVRDILEYMGGGMTEGEILQDFPYLLHEDILACLQYAAKKEDVVVQR